MVTRHMQITVDRDKCVGAGNCVLAAGDVFDQDDEDGRNVILDPDPAEDQFAAVERAAVMCPTSAISYRYQQR